MNWITSLLSNLNYGTVYLLMLLESTVVPVPSELVVAPAAYHSAAGHLNIWLVVLFATLGAMTGATINYLAGYYLGRPIIYKFANSRLGHLCLLNQSKVEKSEKYFDDHGMVATITGRLIPGIRHLISIPAGLARMNVGRFALFTSLGALVWNAVLAFVGWILSRTVTPDQLFAKVEEYNKYLTWGGYALLALCVLYILYNALKKHKTGSESDTKK